MLDASEVLFRSDSFSFQKRLDERVAENHVEFNNLNFAMPPTAGYPQTYLEAKDLFIIAARDIAEELQTIHQVFDERELVELDTDVAWIGNRDAKHLIIHIAGTHGVEALPGSAIQLDLLKRLPDAVADPFGDTAILFVHLLNPWGAHHNRAANENNVNLMNNWTSDAATLTGAPKGFSSFVDKTLLNTPSPPQIFMSSFKFKATAAVCACTMGAKAFASSVGFPQYVNPDGIFYGGKEIEDVVASLGKYLESALSSKTLEHVTVIDIHTGIGDEYGGSQTMTLRSNTAAASDRVQRLRKEYPIFRNLKTLDPDLFKNSVHEYIESLLRKHGSKAQFLGIHQDFGTYNQLATIEALALENRHYQYTDPSWTIEEKQWKTKKTNEWRTYCASFFAPEDEKWWDKVVRGGRELVETVIGLMDEAVKGKDDGQGREGGVRSRS